MESVTYDYFNPSSWGSHRQIVSLVGSNKRVLDLGCSTGRLAEAIKENDNAIYGVELNPHNAELARRICEEVFVGSIENISQFSLEKNSFDVILLADVLEHIPHPEDVLITLKDYLKDDGCILVSLPNVAHLYVRAKLLFGVFDYEPSGILDRTHLKFFTYKTARDLLISCGYRISDVSVTIPNYPRCLAHDSRLALFYKSCLALANLWKSGLAFQFIFRASKQ